MVPYQKKATNYLVKIRKAPAKKGKKYLTKKAKTHQVQMRKVLGRKKAKNYLTKVGSEVEVCQVAKCNYGRCLVPNLLNSHHETWNLQKFFQSLRISMWPNSP